MVDGNLQLFLCKLLVHKVIYLMAELGSKLQPSTKKSLPQLNLATVTASGSPFVRLTVCQRNKEKVGNHDKFFVYRMRVKSVD